LSAYEWRECGVGQLRVLSPADDAGRAASVGRVVMRREKTEALILNVSVRGMTAATAGDKAVQFTCFKVCARALQI
jgi:hypothetical protein